MLRPMYRYVEVSHPIEAGMKTYPGLPEPSVEVLLDYGPSRERYQGKAEFLIASLHLCGNTGTYVDSPRHRYRDGADLAAIPLEAVAHVPVTKLDARALPARGVAAEVFKGVEIAGRAVLIN
ncbi:MAG TPA: cyclase family protein, partial [Bryobacteraceae bacterium]|nr:cyclase family protein [Bryobacteraceae bacterium]